MSSAVNQPVSASLPGRITTRAHAFIAPALFDGAVAVDATAGSGHDTLLLARRVGSAGVVHAFDIQTEAIARARRRLADAGLSDRVRWHHCCHSTLGEVLDTTSIAAAMFNLGWLPGGDRTRITRPDTTCGALARAAERLAPGGRISIVAYRGHPGGTAEQNAVAEWLRETGHGLVCQFAESASKRDDAPVFYGFSRPMP